MKASVVVAVAAAVLAMASACSHLSSHAQRIAGDYYIPEVSEDQPIMELRSDGTCTFRAIRPGVLTYQVEGEWDVDGGMLTASLDTASVTFTGDSTLIGKIPQQVSRRIIKDSDTSMDLEQDGVAYTYHRRYHAAEPEEGKKK